VIEPATPTPGPSKRHGYLWAGLAVVLVIVVIAVIAAVRPRPQSSYDDAVRGRFIGACTAQGGAPVQNTCACLYREIEQNVSFDRFELVDEMLAAQLQARTAPDQPLLLPEDINAMLQDCIARAA
jgi:uncharacterized protein involved in exopolysaccharide biosynthesis